MSNNNTSEINGQSVVIEQLIQPWQNSTSVSISMTSSGLPTLTGTMYLQSFINQQGITMVSFQLQFSPVTYSATTTPATWVQSTIIPTAFIPSNTAYFTPYTFANTQTIGTTGHSYFNIINNGGIGLAIADTMSSQVLNIFTISGSYKL